MLLQQVVFKVFLLGSMRWNFIYNGVFSLGVSEETTLVGFADDLSMIIGASDCGFLKSP